LPFSIIKVVSWWVRGEKEQRVQVVKDGWSPEITSSSSGGRAGRYLNGSANERGKDTESGKVK